MAEVKILSERTLIEYERRLAILAREGFPTAEKLVKTPATVIATVNTHAKSVSTKQAYYSAILWKIRSEIPLADLSDYKKELGESFVESRAKQTAQKLPPKAEEKFLTWPEILDLKDKVKELFGELSQEYVCYCLYTLQPPVRGDYANCPIVARINRGEGNRVVIGKARSTFIFTDYKTAKTYSTVKLVAPVELHKLLSRWKEGRTHLLDVTTPGGLFQLLRRVFERVAGKEISVNILRHSFITWWLSKPRSIKEKEAMSKRMLHSKEVQETYAIFPEK